MKGKRLPEGFMLRISEVIKLLGHAQRLRILGEGAGVKSFRATFYETKTEKRGQATFR